MHIRMSSWESRRLRQIRDHAAFARMVKRATCLLRSAAGESAGTIARVTGLSRDTISDIRRRWRKGRLGSVVDQPRSGRPPRISARYRRELRKVLERSPLRYGYVFTLWSIARLGSYLQKRTGIRFSSGHLRRVVHAEGFVLARPKHTLANKRDPRQYRRAQRKLQRLKRGQNKRTRAMNSGMPMPASSNCCRIWSAAGCGRASNSRCPPPARTRRWRRLAHSDTARGSCFGIPSPA